MTKSLIGLCPLDCSVIKDGSVSVRTRIRTGIVGVEMVWILCRPQAEADNSGCTSHIWLSRVVGSLDEVTR